MLPVFHLLLAFNFYHFYRFSVYCEAKIKAKNVLKLYVLYALHVISNILNFM